MINKDLAEIVAFLDVYALRCQERPTVKELRMKVREALQREAPALNLSMNQWIDKFIREQGGNAGWELSTRHAMHTLQKHVRQFGKAHDLEYFDADGITAFIKYLREQAQLQASTLPEDAAETRLHWSSSNSRVCRVDQNGLARGGFPGSAVLTVTAERSEAVAQIPVQVSGGAVPLLLMGMLVLLALLLLLYLILTIRRKIRNRWRPKHSEEEWQKPK